MDAQAVILGARVAHVRELKTEVARLKEENAALRDELCSLKAHFDLALLAAEDVKDGEPLEIWDGWNLILGAQKIAKGRAELIAQAQATGRRVWIVFDGPDERVVSAGGRVRVSYTGGTGEHRADKFIVNFVRMAAYLGRGEQISVRTNDRDFLKKVRALQRTAKEGECL